MAFSMFLRSPAVMSKALSQQLTRAVMQPHFCRRSVSNFLPASSVTIKTSQSTPICNAVRSFRTSATRLTTEHPHDHAKLWVIEKATSGILVGLLPLALIFPNKVLDSALAILITAHSFWGLEAIAVDYVRAAIFGPMIPKIAIGLVYAISIATLGGLFYLIGHDVGIAHTIRNLWAIKSDQKA